MYFQLGGLLWQQLVITCGLTGKNVSELYRRRVLAHERGMDYACAEEPKLGSAMPPLPEPRTIAGIVWLVYRETFFTMTLIAV